MAFAKSDGARYHQTSGGRRRGYGNPTNDGQIPGLSEVPVWTANEDPKKQANRETDSDYVRLAKMGGRSDLPHYRASEQQPSEAFQQTSLLYQDNNTQGDRGIKSNSSKRDAKDSRPGDFYQTLQAHPEPISPVHRTVRCPSATRTTQAPYACDDTNVFQREGSMCTDKTVKIEERKRSGYGVRQNGTGGGVGTKLEVSKPMAAMPHHMQVIQPAVERMERARAPVEEWEEARSRYKPQPLSKEMDQGSMSKLMSFGYGQDDLDQRQQHEGSNGDQQSSGPRYREAADLNMKQQPPRVGPKENGTAMAAGDRGGGGGAGGYMTEYQEKMQATLAAARLPPQRVNYAARRAESKDSPWSMHSDAPSGSRLRENEANYVYVERKKRSEKIDANENDVGRQLSAQSRSRSDYDLLGRANSYAASAYANSAYAEVNVAYKQRPGTRDCRQAVDNLANQHYNPGREDGGQRRDSGELPIQNGGRRPYDRNDLPDQYEDQRQAKTYKDFKDYKDMNYEDLKDLHLSSKGGED